MAPTFSRPVDLTEEARRIFFIVDGFLRSSSTHRPSPALERFPPSFETTPWRRVYMASGAHSTAYLTMEPWDPSELSSGSARGIFWLFTELPRIRGKICRKTVDGQTWSDRSGRGYKNGFPVEIRVAKLVIKDTAYRMLELTLDEQMPTVSLCKIWRMGTAAAESPQTMNQGTSTSNQVEDNLEATEMQIDQPQGQFEGIEQQLRMTNHEMSMSDYTMCPKSTEECWNIYLTTGQLEGKEPQSHVPGHKLSMSDEIVHPYSAGENFKFNLIGQHEGTEQQLHIPHHELSTSNYTCHPNYTFGQFEGIEYEPDMPDQAMLASSYIVPPNSMWGVEEQVKMHEDVPSMSDYIVLPKFTKDFIPFTGQDDDIVDQYQGAVSYLYEEKESFKHIALHGGNEAHEIASKAQSLASAMRNLLNGFPFLRINTEPASNTTNNNQLRTTTNSVTEQPTVQAPETRTQDEFSEQERSQQRTEGCSIMEDYFCFDDFINVERGAGTDFDDQGHK